MPQKEQVILRRGPSSTKPETVVPGTILIETDTGDVFLDNASNERIQLKDSTKLPKDGTAVAAKQAKEANHATNADTATRASDDINGKSLSGRVTKVENDETTGQVKFKDEVGQVVGTAIDTQYVENAVKHTHKFALDFETISIEKSINDTTDYKLSLIATKRDNTYYADKPYGQLPIDIGYLYMDEITQKLYYSSVKYNNPKYLCDWQTQIGDVDVGNCSDYVAHITYEGDIIFIKNPVSSVDRFACEDPIIYKYDSKTRAYVASIISFEPTNYSEVSESLYERQEAMYYKGLYFTSTLAASVLIKVEQHKRYRFTVGGGSTHNRFSISGYKNNPSSATATEADKQGTELFNSGLTAIKTDADTAIINSSEYNYILVFFWYGKNPPDNTPFTAEVKDIGKELPEGTVFRDGETAYGIKPFGFIMNRSIENGYEIVDDIRQNFFIYGEYRSWATNTSQDGTPLVIWKVNAPYNTMDCWNIVHVMYHTRYSSSALTIEGMENKQIGHFHTCQFDPYSGAYIASTGDKQYQLHILMSTDNGATFVDQTPTSSAGEYSGTSLRFVGLVFTKDYIYYQVDDQATHAFFRLGRDTNGLPDVSSLEKICSLASGVAGYGLMLSREPYGIFLLDKREDSKESTVTTIEYKFYSLDDDKLYSLGTFNAIDGYATFEQQGRYGLPARAITIYQSPYEDGMIMGTSQSYKPLTIDILNNNKNRIIGVIKAKIKQIN